LLALLALVVVRDLKTGVAMACDVGQAIALDIIF